MCGRYVTPDEAEIERWWHIGRHNWKSPFESIRQARFNVPPQQGSPANHIPVIRSDQEGILELTDMQWWLLPSWAKTSITTYSTFNARVETVESSSTFKVPFRSQRCLIPARGWYEWQTTAKGKQPWYFHAPEGELLAFAGIWDRWEREGKLIESCAIIVGEAPHALSHVHHRAPFLIPRETQALWLNPSLTDVTQVRELLLQDHESRLELHPVSREVGNVRNQGPGLIKAIAEEG